MPKKTRVHEEVVLEDGKLRSHRKISSYRSNDEDFFIKLYLGSIEKFKSLTSADMCILFVLCKYIDYKNIIHPTMAIKKKVMSDTGYSHQTVKNSILNLSKKGILIRQSMSTYLVNPEYIGKGSWSAISELRAELSGWDKEPKGRGR